jgi:hypothetical protein
VLTAAALRLHGATRIVSVLVISASVLVPFAIAPGMTTTGHLLSVATGAIALALLTRRGRSARPRRGAQQPAQFEPAQFEPAQLEPAQREPAPASA